MKRLSLPSSDKNNSKQKRQHLESKTDGVNEGDEDDEEKNLSSTSTGHLKTFKRILSKAGMKLRWKHPPILSVDQAVFQRDLTSILKDKATQRQVLEEFIDGFGEFIEDTRKLWWCLNPTETHPDCDSARSAHQDSVVRLLLGISNLQPQLMTILLDKLLELSSNDASIFDGGDFRTVPKLILFQFRWLDTIVDSSALCEKLLEIASVVSAETHKEIIACIPEILEDKDHETVAIAWSELLKQKTEFTSAILDSLPNLNVSTDVLVEVKSSVLKSLEVIEVELFPVVVKFLLQSLTPTDAIEILSELRLMLDFSVDDTSTTNGPSESYKVLTLDVIKTAVQFQKLIGDSLVKVLDQSKTDKKPNLVDLFLVFVLASIPSRRKAAENILTMKIHNKTITEALIQKAFKNMKQVCQEYFSPMLSLSDSVFGATNETVREFGGVFHLVTFTEMGDPSILQEVIASLLSHIRSGNDLEIDIALNVLKQIVVAEPKKVMPFSVFLKGLLDRLDSLSLRHFRKVYEILTILGQSSEASGRGVLDDLHILVRKQLTNSEQRYRRMGVVGALATLKRSSDSIVDSDLSSMKTLVNMVELNIGKDFEAKALFFEELSTAISRNELQSKLQEWLGERITDDFQDVFLIDVDENPVPKISDMDVQLEFQLHSIAENGIAVNMLKIAYEDETFLEKSCITKRLRLPCLAPQFRLMALCELASHDQSLEGIDALLGCPVYMFSSDLSDRFDTHTRLQRRIICRCLFGTINWFIELINVFITQKDEEIINKVVKRIQQMVELRGQLEKCLKGTPEFIPPLAHFDNEYDDKESTTMKPKRNVTAKDKPAKTSKRKRSKTTQLTSDLDCTTSGNQMDLSTKEKEQKSSSDKTIDLNQYAVFFRELDMEVFFVFNCELELKRSVDNDSAAKLGPSEMSFLLKNFHSKLEAVIGKPLAKTLFVKAKFAESECIHRRLKSRSKIKFVKFSVKLLKLLQPHLEKIADFLREQSDESDDDEDEQQLNNFVLITDCFCYILDNCSILFGWDGFDDRSNKVLLSKLLQYFDKDKSASSQSPITHLTEQCFEYFRNYSSVTANFDCSASLMKLLNVVANLNPKKQLDGPLVEVCEEVLKRDWNLSSETMKTTKYGSQLTSILKIYFNASDNVLESLETLTTKAIPEMIKSIGKSECSETFPTLTKHTLPVYYELIHRHLISFLRGLDTDKEKSPAIKLRSWLIGVRIFHILSQIIKEFDSHRIVLLCLKYGRVFIELFVKSAMPVIDRLFRIKKEDVNSLLKSLQQSTRFLHNVCGHSKVAKNVALTGSVPPLRKALEIFVLRVKEMLAVNNCKDAFWLGNLKNRNLQGEEILSQVANERDDDEEEDENGSKAEDENDEDEEATKESSKSSLELEGSDDESVSGNISESY